MDVIRFTPEGWRARLDGDFSDKNVARVASGLGAMWSNISDSGRIYVGYDTRARAGEMARLASSILAEWGLDVHLSNRACPLPALSYTTMQDVLAQGALMFTASGAGAEYLGMVIRNGIGQIPDDEDYEALEALIPAEAPALASEPPESWGPNQGGYVLQDLIEPYIAALLDCVDTAAIARVAPLVVVDPLFGAGTNVLAQALVRAGARVVQIHTESRPDFAGLHPRPVDPWLDECEQEVVARAAWAGFALDGDADRLGSVDAQGNFVSSHRQNPLLVRHLVADKGERGRVIMQMSGSNYLHKEAERMGLAVSRVPIGFTNCYREFGRDDGLVACGEQGGIAFLQHSPERDGSLAALLLVEMMAQHEATLSELLAELEGDLGHWEYAQQDLTLDVAQVQSLRNILPGLNPPQVAGAKPTKVSHADGLRLEFASGAWLLMRPSRSYPVVRIYAEATTKTERDKLIVAARGLCSNPTWD